MGSLSLVLVKITIEVYFLAELVRKLICRVIPHGLNYRLFYIIETFSDLNWSVYFLLFTLVLLIFSLVNDPP